MVVNGFIVVLNIAHANRIHSKNQQINYIVFEIVKSKNANCGLFYRKS